jgi:hypothetical protein
VKRYGRLASDAKVKFDAVRVLDRPRVETPTPAATALAAQPEAVPPRLVAIEGGRQEEGHPRHDRTARPARRTSEAAE